MKNNRMRLVVAELQVTTFTPVAHEAQATFGAISEWNDCHVWFSDCAECLDGGAA